MKPTTELIQQSNCLKKKLWTGQERLLNDQDKDFHAIVSGYGYGKTTFGIRWHFQRVLANINSPLSMVIGADYRLLREVCFPFYVAFLEEIGLFENLHFKINKSNLTITLLWNNHKILFISAERPKKIASYTVSHALFDEPARCSEEANQNLVGRVRCPLAAMKNQILYTTTPEGLNWFYEMFSPEKLDREGRFSESKSKLVLHGSSFDNPELPMNFFTNHMELFGWDSDLFNNYMMGNWTNLSKDKFYYEYKEHQHIKPNFVDWYDENLYLTFDNNVGHMAWVAAQVTFGRVRFLTDNGGNGRNIDDALNQFMAAYPPSEYGKFVIHVYGDAVLHHRSLHSYQTGYAAIRDILSKHYKDVIIKAARSNPLVEEKNRHTNRLLKQGKVTISKDCKKLIESLRSTELINGKAKKGGRDLVSHAGEAMDMLLIELIKPLTRIDANGRSW